MLELSQLGCVRGQRLLFRQVSATLAGGTLLRVTGANGAGKTSLLRMLCGLLPAVIVMEALRQLGGLTAFEPVGYSTSADVTGDPSRVVGYAGALLG